MQRKTIIVAAILLVALTAVVHATGQGEPQTIAEDGGIVVAPEGVFPIVDQPLTVTVFIEGPSDVSDYEDNAFAHWVSEVTNVSMSIEAPITDAGQRRNLLMASGDYPEIFMAQGSGFSPAQQFLYGQQGVFVPLNSLIEEYGENARAVFAEFPRVERNFTMPDGNIYSLPRIPGGYHASMSMKAWLYMPWLDEIGMDMPQTIEEFRDLLVAIRDDDLNGNGDASDEIPLAGSTWWQSGIDGFLMNSFIYSHDDLTDGANADRLRVVDGVVDAVYDDLAFREGLEYISGLYADDLIAPESLVQDRNQFIQMGENPDAVILGVALSGAPIGFSVVGGESRRWLDYKTIPPLEGPDGVRLTHFRPIEGLFAFTMTDKVQSASAAFRLGDFFLGREATLRNFHGRKGIEWDDPQPGALGRNGEPATWQQLVEWSNLPSTVWWGQVGPINTSPDLLNGQAPPPGTSRAESHELVLHEETFRNYAPYTPDASVIMPPLNFPGESVAAEYTELRSSLNDYVNEMIARFIVGDADIDRLWDSYLDELDKIGLNRYLEILQASYDTWAQ